MARITLGRLSVGKRKGVDEPCCKGSFHILLSEEGTIPRLAEACSAYCSCCQTDILLCLQWADFAAQHKGTSYKLHVYVAWAKELAGDLTNGSQTDLLDAAGISAGSCQLKLALLL